MAAVEQELAFCTAPDGVRIAYATYGERRGPAVFYAGGFESQEWVWRLPEGRRFLEKLAGVRRLITFDYRGTGASQREVDAPSPGYTGDLGVVADHLGLERCAVFSLRAVGAIYAALYPERVDRLILWTPRLRDDPYPPATLRMIRESWGLFTRASASVVYPDGPPEAQRWISDAMRASCTPEYVAAVSAQEFDFAPYLPRVACPTLILHPQAVQYTPVPKGREAAALIPDAKFVALPGSSNYPYWGQDDYMPRLLEFLAVEPEASPGLPSGTAVILFTDIADSTALTERMGDAAFREASRPLDERCRAAIRDAGGTPVEGKVLGDGVMAVFTSARQAIDAALRCQGAAEATPLRLHCGVHAGDVIREGSNVYGGAVNVAARIAGASAAGETLVSATVRDLARTSAGVAFEDRGEHALKGIEDAQRLYAVRAREA